MAAPLVTGGMEKVDVFGPKNAYSITLYKDACIYPSSFVCIG